MRLGGRSGTIKAAIVQGTAPLLISRNALKTLQAATDFAANELTLFQERITVPLVTNEAGQYTVDLLGEQDVSLKPFAEVMNLEAVPGVDCSTAVSAPDAPADDDASMPSVQASADPCLPSGSSSLVSCSRSDFGCPKCPQ